MPASDECYVRQTHLIYRIVAAETLLVNAVTNEWHRFNEVGTQILERLKRPATVEQIVTDLSTQFESDEVSPEELFRDIDEFIQYLLQQRIIRLDSVPPAPRSKIRIDDWRDELDAAGVELEIPTWAKIELSTACHLHCAHCYIPEGQRSLKRELTVLRQQEELSDSEILSVIDQLAEMGCLLLTLTGGEIFIKKNIFEILKHAHERGFVLELFTSATPLTLDKISVLSELNIGRIQVSVYSHDSEIHDNFTGSIGSWKRSVDAIKLMVESGLHVELVCSIVPDNYRDLAKIRELAESVGASCSYGYPITSRTDGNADTHLLRLDKQQMRHAIFSVPSFFALPEPKAKSDRICPAAVNMCSVTSHGDILPCSQFNLPAGNVRTGRLADIWHNSPLFAKLRSSRMGDLKNPNGKELPSYVGLCPGLNLLEEGDFLIPAAITVETTEAVREIIEDNSVSEEITYRLTHPDETRMRSEA